MFDLKKNNLTGIPDGMTIDKAGNLWVANHGGGLVKIIFKNNTYYLFILLFSSLYFCLGT